MEPTTEFEFNVDEQYENEKGVFTVVSIHKDEMAIRWESGEEIRTEIDFQRRIQERRQREKFTKETAGNAARGQSRKSAALRVSPEFEGLQPSDFKNSAARTNWRGRKQLGSAVTIKLPPDKFTFNSWAFAQRPEMHWADVEHRSADNAAYQARFFVKVDDQSMIYGFCVTRPDDQSGSSKDWISFASWLGQSENDRTLQSLAIEKELAVYDFADSEKVTLVPFEGGWRVEGGDVQQEVDTLAAHIDSVPPAKRIDLVIARRTSKDDVLKRGQDIAGDIAALFALLMPLYQASVV
jgi:hypothetical protein